MNLTSQFHVLNAKRLSKSSNHFGRICKESTTKKQHPEPNSIRDEDDHQNFVNDSDDAVAMYGGPYVQFKTKFTMNKLSMKFTKSNS